MCVHTGSCCQEWTPSRMWLRFCSLSTEFHKSSNTSRFIVPTRSRVICSQIFFTYSAVYNVFECLKYSNVISGAQIRSVKTCERQHCIYALCACVRLGFLDDEMAAAVVSFYHRDRPSSVKLASVKHELYHPLLPTLRRMDMDDVVKRLPHEHTRTSTPCYRGGSPTLI